MRVIIQSAGWMTFIVSIFFSPTFGQGCEKHLISIYEMGAKRFLFETKDGDFLLAPLSPDDNHRFEVSRILDRSKLKSSSLYWWKGTYDVAPVSYSNLLDELSNSETSALESLHENDPSLTFGEPIERVTFFNYRPSVGRHLRFAGLGAILAAAGIASFSPSTRFPIYSKTMQSSVSPMTKLMTWRSDKRLEEMEKGSYFPLYRSLRSVFRSVGSNRSNPWITGSDFEEWKRFEEAMGSKPEAMSKFFNQLREEFARAPVGSSILDVSIEPFQHLGWEPSPYRLPMSHLLAFLEAIPDSPTKIDGFLKLANDPTTPKAVREHVLWRAIFHTSRLKDYPSEKLKIFLKSRSPITVVSTARAFAKNQSREMADEIVIVVLAILNQKSMWHTVTTEEESEFLRTGSTVPHWNTCERVTYLLLDALKSLDRKRAIELAEEAVRQNIICLEHLRKIKEKESEWQAHEEVVARWR